MEDIQQISELLSAIITLVAVIGVGIKIGSTKQSLQNQIEESASKTSAKMSNDMGALEEQIKMIRQEFNQELKETNRKIDSELAILKNELTELKIVYAESAAKKSEMELFRRRFDDMFKENSNQMNELKERVIKIEVERNK